MNKFRAEKRQIIKMMDHLLIEVDGIVHNEEQAALCKKYMGKLEFFFAECGECYTVEQINKLIMLNERYLELGYWKAYKTKHINQIKEDLQLLLSKAVEFNQLSTDNKYIRRLNPKKLIDKNVISVFESSLTRILGMETDRLSTDLMVIKTYFFDIIQDIIHNGFMYNGEKYVFFTASAGQIRTKKTVFIKESLWKEHERTLMCGLSIADINAKGGINVNKFLAYLALSNSATDEWVGFDIDRCIVVPDFESDVHGEVDYINDITYEVKRQEMDIGIEHTDGCGMMLPCVNEKNFMIRAPWIKGLLGVMDFRRFIDEHGCSPVIKDIYGQEHDLIAEDIQIIFTKSMFKLHKYYDSWDDYKDNFKKYNCQVGTCKEEEDRVRSSQMSYQMLQTLTDITDEEIRKIAKPAVDKLENITSNISTMLDAFGAVRGRKNLNYLQQALLLYPELLNDSYCKRRLNDIKNSMVNRFRAGKLPVKGKYAFVLPDLYAVCQHLFLHMDNPPGLLENGEVSCRLYKRAEKLDCLRSPHLYREHAVRRNVVNDTTEEWFQTDAIYTSCKDNISRILQFDCDGDTLLVVADKTIIEVAERNMQGIVPLYYEMKKAEPTILTNEKFYEGMTAAWTGGNIGEISNDITKIWNNDNGIGDDELLAIKLYCMENNYVIDYAKTLYKPTRPPEIDALIKKYTRSKLPNFFIEAKGYKRHQVEDVNNSFVNKLRGIIKRKRLSFKNIDVFSYRKLMYDRESTLTDKDLIREYENLSSLFPVMANTQNDDSSGSNIPYFVSNSKKRLLEFGYSEQETTDILIKHLYTTDSQSKTLMWNCFGDIIVSNLKKNLNPRETYCKQCGKRFIPKANANKYCDSCFEEKHKNVDYRIITCIDCGKTVRIPKSSKKTKRCSECQTIENKRLDRERKRKQRAKNK